MFNYRIGRTGRIGKGGISTALLTRQDAKHFPSLYEVGSFFFQSVALVFVLS